MTTKIKLLRIKRLIPQFQVARSVGLSSGKLSQIESGVQSGSASICAALAEYYSIEPEEYFYFFNDNRNQPRAKAILYENK